MWPACYVSPHRIKQLASAKANFLIKSYCSLLIKETWDSKQTRLSERHNSSGLLIQRSREPINTLLEIQAFIPSSRGLLIHCQSALLQDPG